MTQTICLYSDSLLEKQVRYQKPIDYGMLDRAKKFYASNGYIHVEAPWFVPNEYASLTYSGVPDCDSKVMVGSGEQSLLYMLDHGLLECESIIGKLNPFTRLMTITPCFRNESSVDQTRNLYFMKLELMIVVNTKAFKPDTSEVNIKNSIGSEYDRMVSFAKTFHKKELDRIAGNIENATSQIRLSIDRSIVSVPTLDGYDLMFHTMGDYSDTGIEIGSYGLRSCTLPSTEKEVRWIYGTGLALPRFSACADWLKQRFSVKE